jgi:hypothetical protein
MLLPEPLPGEPAPAEPAGADPATAWVFQWPTAVPVPLRPSEARRGLQVRVVARYCGESARPSRAIGGTMAVTHIVRITSLAARKPGHTTRVASFAARHPKITTTVIMTSMRMKRVAGPVQAAVKDPSTRAEARRAATEASRAASRARAVGLAAALQDRQVARGIERARRHATAALNGPKPRRITRRRVLLVGAGVAGATGGMIVYSRRRRGEAFDSSNGGFSRRVEEVGVTGAQPSGEGDGA